MTLYLPYLKESGVYCRLCINREWCKKYWLVVLSIYKTGQVTVTRKIPCLTYRDDSAHYIIVGVCNVDKIPLKCDCRFCWKEGRSPVDEILPNIKIYKTLMMLRKPLLSNGGTTL